MHFAVPLITKIIILLLVLYHRKGLASSDRKKKMKGFRIVLVSFLICVLGLVSTKTIDPDELIRRAEEDINRELRELTKLGARSNRFVHKKLTPV